MGDKNKFRERLVFTEKYLEEKQSPIQVTNEFFQIVKNFYDDGFIQGVNFVNTEVKLSELVAMIQRHFVNKYNDTLIYTDKELEDIVKLIYNKGYTDGTKYE